MRDFDDLDGTRWRAEWISHGGTSKYLNPKVHQPILQFSCLSGRRPRRYLGYATENESGLDALSNTDLQQLLERATAH